MIAYKIEYDPANPSEASELQLKNYSSAWADLMALPVMQTLFGQKSVFDAIGPMQNIGEAYDANSGKLKFKQHGTISSSNLKAALAEVRKAAKDSISYLEGMVSSLESPLKRIGGRTPTSRAQHIFGIYAGRFPSAIGTLLNANPNNAGFLCQGLKQVAYRNEMDAIGWGYLGVLTGGVTAFIAAPSALGAGFFSLANLYRVMSFGLMLNTPMFADATLEASAANQYYGQLAVLNKTLLDFGFASGNSKEIEEAMSRLNTAYRDALINGVLVVGETGAIFSIIYKSLGDSKTVQNLLAAVDDAINRMKAGKAGVKSAGDVCQAGLGLRNSCYPNAKADLDRAAKFAKQPVEQGRILMSAVDGSKKNLVEIFTARSVKLEIYDMTLSTKEISENLIKALGSFVAFFKGEVDANTMENILNQVRRFTSYNDHPLRYFSPDSFARTSKERNGIDYEVFEAGQLNGNGDFAYWTVTEETRKAAAAKFAAMKEALADANIDISGGLGRELNITLDQAIESMEHAQGWVKP